MVTLVEGLHKTKGIASNDDSPTMKIPLDCIWRTSLFKSTYTS